MSGVVADTDMDALAAEYVLGTLGTEERSHAQALLGIDPGFSANVKLWERRLGELHLMVDPVDPDAQIWTRIKAKVPATPQNPPPLRIETAPAEPVPAEPATNKETQSPASDTSAAAVVAAADAVVAAAAAASQADAAVSAPTATDTAAPAVSPLVPSVPAESAPPADSAVPSTAPAEPATAPASAAVPAAVALKPAPVTTAAAPFPSAPRAPLVTRDNREAKLRRRVGRWRSFSTLLILIMLACGGLVAAWRYYPERVPPMLQPLEALRALGIVIKTQTGPPPRPPAPPESQFDE